MSINQMSTLPVRKEYGSRFVGGTISFSKTQVRFQQRKAPAQVTPYFRAINSKVVGFHEDATENLYSLPPLRNVILVLSQGHVSPTISFLMIACCACNPPVVYHRNVALCNLHLWADCGGVIDGQRHSTKNGKVEL